jgi:hypothetical protein
MTVVVPAFAAALMLSLILAVGLGPARVSPLSITKITASYILGAEDLVGHMDAA